MIAAHAHWRAFIDRQHRDPSGMAGRIVGERMVRQHAPETAWTVDLLRIQPHEHVLELGCGAGRGVALAAHAAARGFVLGVDLSATMIQAARRRNRAAHRTGRVALLRGDLRMLPVTPAAFDAIFSIHTFYFWPDPAQQCRHLLARLRPGGRLAITLSTGQRDQAGAYQLEPLHGQVEALVHTLHALPGVHASLARGPDSRQYNNIAILAQKGT